MADWLEIQRLIGERAPDIDVRIVANGLPHSATRRWQARRPSLVFSPVALHRYRPPGGTIYAGQPRTEINKLSEVLRLGKAGLPIPRTVPYTPWLKLDEGEWGEFVVAKPTIGGGGRGVRLIRTAHLKIRYANLTRRFGQMMVQQFIEHTNEEGRPGGYRVLTLFGRELYAIYRSREPRTRTLAEIADDPLGVIAFNFNEEGSVERFRELSDDREVIDLSCRISAAFPERPVLGIDIVRDTATGKPVIMECNPSGRVWHLSSATADRLDPTFLAAIRGQFNAISRTADILIDRTRAEAT